ncbi:MAG: hypothetical protein WD489_11210 [Rhodovibrionaceae bacterium]
MIYLRDRNLLFLKPRKTAGTSVEIALSRHAGPGDIVTPLVLGDELLRMELGGQFPINWSDPILERDYAEQVERHRDSAELNKTLFSLKSSRYVNHMNPRQIVEAASERFLLESEVVTMCRHPYEVFVSQVYYFMAYQKLEVSFTQLADELAHKVYTNVAYYGYRGRTLPRFVIRYEQMKEDMRQLEKDFDLDLLAKLPVTKKGKRADRRPAGELLTECQKEICYTRNKAIFERFGYAR